MKRIISILIFVFLFNIVKGQDGLLRYFDTDSVDTFISVYNAPYKVNEHVAEYIVFQIESFETMEEGPHYMDFGFCNVHGMLYVTIKDTYRLYDFYVEKTVYFNGQEYTADRFKQPKKKNRN